MINSMRSFPGLYLGHLLARRQRNIETIGKGWLACGKVCGGDASRKPTELFNFDVAQVTQHMNVDANVKRLYQQSDRWWYMKPSHFALHPPSNFK